MRILHVITSLWTGGAEKLMVDLLPRLKAKGHDVELLTFNGEMTPFRKELLANGIKIHDFGNRGSLLSLYSPLNILKIIPFMRKYDVIHTHNTAPQLFAAIGSMFGGAKLITTEHSTCNRRRGKRIFAIADRFMYSRYHKIICISKKAEYKLREHIGQFDGRILTINNGTDVNKFAKAKPTMELENIAPNTRKIVMVAGFRSAKDQDTLIRAIKSLPSKFHLFLIGDGERRGVLENLIIKSGLNERIHLLGERVEIPNLLQAADYIVMSSHYEGLSLSSVEGMSVGKPFIASDVDGLREVVYGAGLLFPHNDARGFSEIIIGLEKDKSYYEEIADRCMERARNFDLSKMVEEYNSLYFQV